MSVALMLFIANVSDIGIFTNILMPDVLNPCQMPLFYCNDSNFFMRILYTLAFLFLCHFN
jgi:hypothetical protein